jgi:multiple sugar transport system substrate-binding protein
MSTRITLRGITWNHSRAFPPLVATGQRFEERHPEIEIHWQKRSLHEFGHSRLEPVARDYDLAVIDHPMMGAVYDAGVFVNLKPLLDREFLSELAGDSVGSSFESYCFREQLLALPIDAAAPAASYRADLLLAAEVDVPRTWTDVLDLARRKLVIMPGFHPDVFLNFVGLCVSRTGGFAENPEHLIDLETGMETLENLREIASGMSPAIFDWNPIAVYEQMAESRQYAYCPFAYSYNNYSRVGFASNILLFASPVALSSGRPMRTVLGGTGVGISTSCSHVPEALEYAKYLAGKLCQRTIYGLSGGQPARRSAWSDDTMNAITNRFFLRTLDCVQAAWVRPRYNGYIQLQETAGIPIVDYLRAGGNARAVLESLDELYRGSKKARFSNV